MKPSPLPEGEHTIVLEISAEMTRLAVDGVERFSGKHGLKSAKSFTPYLLGKSDVFPKGREVWIRSAKMEE